MLQLTLLACQVCASAAYLHSYDILETVDKSLKVPHIFAIQVDILDGEYLINSNPLFTDDIFDPGKLN